MPITQTLTHKVIVTEVWIKPCMLNLANINILGLKKVSPFQNIPVNQSEINEVISDGQFVISAKDHAKS